MTLQGPAPVSIAKMPGTHLTPVFFKFDGEVASSLSGAGFWVQGFRCRVPGPGCRIPGAGCGVQGAG